MFDLGEFQACSNPVTFPFVALGFHGLAVRAKDGAGNVDTNRFDMPGAAYEGATLRSYDPKTRQWAIWWLDGRSPEGPLDPALKGTFKDGVGTFYADETFRGRPIKVRFIWEIGHDRARWDQAFSPDGGATWETNWITDFARAKG